MKQVYSRYLAGFVFFICWCQAQAQVVVYPSLPASYRSALYEMSVEQTGAKSSVFVNTVSAPAFFHRNSRSHNINSFANFSFAGKVTVTVTRKGKRIRSCQILPKSRQVTPRRVDDYTIAFELDRPGYFSVEFDGDLSHPMLVFANPLETDIPDSTAQNIRYFGPGVHEAGEITPVSGQTIYLAGGAYVKGKIEAADVQNVQIRGRGILSGEDYLHRDGHLIYLRGSANTGSNVVEGITCISSPAYTITLGGENNRVSWAKCIGWLYNNDGIGLGKNGLVEDCFLKVNDDAIKLYFDNMVVQRNTIWQMENGAPFQISWNMQSDAKNIRVTDCDVIRCEQKNANGNNTGIINAYHNGSGHMHDYLFDQIRVTHSPLRLFKLTVDTLSRFYNTKRGPGKISNITLRNIQCDSAFSKPSIVQGVSKEHGISTIRIENLQVGDKWVTSKADFPIAGDDVSVSGVRFKVKSKNAVNPLSKQGNVWKEEGPATFSNPIIPGFHPDPSICRVGEDYYLVTSSFEWFPGVPIFHSRDLVNWKKIGHVLSRPSQLQMLDGLNASAGIWAPTIRHHQGVFYMITTCQSCGGNFYVTATQAEGPWSDPVFIPNSPGIDPSLFFDDDGRVWYTGGGTSLGEPEAWKRQHKVWIQELNLKTGTLVGQRHVLTTGHATNAKFAEGPHLYKRGKKYVLLISEGGTWHNHAVTAFEADSVTGPYTPVDGNPVLSHRQLGLGSVIGHVGHADLVQTQFGDWYGVNLGVRRNMGYTSLGRETFLAPVEWAGTTPVWNPGKGQILLEDVRPNLPWHPWPQSPQRDEFDSDTLGLDWTFLRTPVSTHYSLTRHPGALTLHLNPKKLTELTSPAFVARRQQHFTFWARTQLRFTPKQAGEVAGFAIMQNDRFQYRLELGLYKGLRSAMLVKVENGVETLIEHTPYESDVLVIHMRSDGLSYEFYIGEDNKRTKPFGGIQDGRILSSDVAKGFIGPFMGMYASSNGASSDNVALFDWFEYSY